MATACLLETPHSPPANRQTSMSRHLHEFLSWRHVHHDTTHVCLRALRNRSMNFNENPAPSAFRTSQVTSTRQHYLIVKPA